MLCSDADFMTEYVVTRWYRAPELLLSCERYDAAIDIWSVGCILAELFLRKPLFQGKDYLSQLKIIIEVLGSPSDEELTFVTAPRARQFIRDLKGIQAGTPQLNLLLALLQHVMPNGRVRAACRVKCQRPAKKTHRGLC